MCPTKPSFEPYPDPKNSTSANSYEFYLILSFYHQLKILSSLRDSLLGWKFNMTSLLAMYALLFTVSIDCRYWPISTVFRCYCALSSKPMLKLALLDGRISRPLEPPLAVSLDSFYV